MGEPLTDEQIAEEEKFLAGLPRVNLGALFLAPVWGPVFLVLAVSYVMDGMIRRRPDTWRGPVYGLTAGAVGLYVLFYPVLIGLMTPTWYTSNILKWLPSWPF